MSVLDALSFWSQLSLGVFAAWGALAWMCRLGDWITERLRARTRRIEEEILARELVAKDRRIDAAIYPGQDTLLGRELVIDIDRLERGDIERAFEAH